MPNRILRDWTDSEPVNELSAEAERFFTRLIMKADDFGFFHANPKLLSSALFPLKEISLSDIESWVNECHVNGLILKYENSGKRYLQIIDFKQRLRTMVSKFPPIAVSLSTTSGQPVDNPPLEVKGSEGKPEEKQKPSVKAHKERFSESFTQIESCQKILLGLKQPYTKESVINLLNEFDPTFYVTYPEGDFQKYCFRFLDYVKDPKRIKLIIGDKPVYKRSTRKGQ